MRCARCGMAGSYKQCGNCGERYCSPSCQKKDWRDPKGHKTRCATLKALRAQFDSLQPAEDWECSICMQDNRKNLMRFMCKHEVCAECWPGLNSNGRASRWGLKEGQTCPVCRHPTTYSPVFAEFAKLLPDDRIRQHYPDEKGQRWLERTLVAYSTTQLEEPPKTERPTLTRGIEALSANMVKMMENDSACASLELLRDIVAVRSRLFKPTVKQPQFKESAAVWHLFEWFKILSHLLPDSDELGFTVSELALCWFCVWAHTAWSTVPVKVATRAPVFLAPLTATVADVCDKFNFVDAVVVNERHLDSFDCEDGPLTIHGVLKTKEHSGFALDIDCEAGAKSLRFMVPFLSPVPADAYNYIVSVTHDWHDWEFKTDFFDGTKTAFRKAVATFILGKIQATSKAAATPTRRRVFTLLVTHLRRLMALPIADGDETEASLIALLEYLKANDCLSSDVKHLAYVIDKCKVAKFGLENMTSIVVACRIVCTDGVFCVPICELEEATKLVV